MKGNRKALNRVGYVVLVLLFFAPIIGCASAQKNATVPDETLDSGRVEKAMPKEPRVREGDMDSESEVLEEEPVETIPRYEIASDLKKTSPPSASARTGSPAKRSGPSGLRAGFSDDNRQFNYFLNFLAQYQHQAPHHKVAVSERIVFHVTDKDGKTVPNVGVEILSDGNRLTTGTTYADGSFMFFPSRFDPDNQAYTAKFSYGGAIRKISFNRNGKRNITVSLDQPRADMIHVPMDLVFILDTTGSMGEEIERLKHTIEIINLNLVSLPSKPEIRFGMILYRDKGDEYVTRTIPLTADLSDFQTALNQVRADGGGDGPEDLQSALKAGLEELEWNTNGIRLGFIITDAPPHLDYNQPLSYDRAALMAKEKGIKLFSVGTGGLSIAGEYVLRQISQLTSASYIFLTYGERGESSGGKTGSVSHHTGDNFQTDKLEAIILKLAREELHYLSEIPAEEPDDYFEARGIDDETRDQTLKKLFDRAVGQLIDYASIRIEGNPPVAVMPVAASDKDTRTSAEYFTEHLGFALSRSSQFTLVDRENMQKVIKELKFQLSGMVDEKKAAEVGKMIGAEMLITGKIYPTRKGCELFLRLVRVETAEVLAVTKLVIDQDLLL